MADTGLPAGSWLFRVERPGVGPSVATLRGDDLVDITDRQAPTARDVCETPDPAAHVAAADGAVIGSLADIVANSFDTGDPEKPRLLAPCDLQVIKACGVTFANSMVERVIEERAEGDAGRAEEIRARIGARIGDTLSAIKPGSDAAMATKAALIEEGLWSQYLEVGIGPDAEVFTKAPVLSAVGHGARVGINPMSDWNNPEPECVLVVNSAGRIVGASLGNDVNLRDVEGRSALLLGKAKDNNASAAIGPAIRLFDDAFGLDDLRRMTIEMSVVGEDDFLLDGSSRMTEISRDLEDLAAQTINANHAYPDGFVLFTGTMFAPVKDRDRPGGGFTHHVGDRVAIRSAELGELVNTVHHCADCPRWDFSASHLMRNLAGRGLI